MKIEGTVLKASEEDRELTGKDGSKRRAKVAHVLMSVGVGKDIEIVNLKAYDASWKLPPEGKPWETPPIKRYENFDGTVADVTV